VAIKKIEITNTKKFGIMRVTIRKQFGIGPIRTPTIDYR
jgi:hypothetical protein